MNSSCFLLVVCVPLACRLPCLLVALLRKKQETWKVIGVGGTGGLGEPGILELLISGDACTSF